jgi:hypothetical protein
VASRFICEAAAGKEKREDERGEALALPIESLAFCLLHAR